MYEDPDVGKCSSGVMGSWRGGCELESETEMGYPRSPGEPWEGFVQKVCCDSCFEKVSHSADACTEPSGPVPASGRLRLLSQFPLPVRLWLALLLQALAEGGGEAQVAWRPQLRSSPCLGRQEAIDWVLASPTGCVCLSIPPRPSGGWAPLREPVGPTAKNPFALQKVMSGLPPIPRHTLHPSSRPEGVTCQDTNRWATGSSALPSGRVLIPAPDSAPRSHHLLLIRSKVLGSKRGSGGSPAASQSRRSWWVGGSGSGESRGAVSTVSWAGLEQSWPGARGLCRGVAGVVRAEGRGYRVASFAYNREGRGHAAYHNS